MESSLRNIKFIYSDKSYENVDISQTFVENIKKGKHLIGSIYKTDGDAQLEIDLSGWHEPYTTLSSLNIDIPEFFAHFVDFYLKHLVEYSNGVIDIDQLVSVLSSQSYNNLMATVSLVGLLHNSYEL